MKKRLFVLPLVFSLALPLGAVEFSLKLTAGLERFRPAGINRILTDWYELQRLEDENRKLWELLEGGVRTITGLFQFEGELMFRFHRRLAVSIGSGFDYAEVDTDGAHVVMRKSTADYDLVHTQKVSAVPVMLSGYYFLPLGKKIQLYARAGGGLLFTRYIDREGSKKVGTEKYSFELDQSTSASAPTYLGALGITVSTPSGLSFLLEAGWRHARVTNLTGETEDWDDWYIYSFEQEYADLGFWRLRHSLYFELPAGEEIRNAEVLTIDLGGFSARVGVMIRF